MKKYVAILLAFVICVGTCSFQATATAEASGTFGNLDAAMILKYDAGIINGF